MGKDNADEAEGAPLPPSIVTVGAASVRGVGGIEGTEARMEVVVAEVLACLLTGLGTETPVIPETEGGSLLHTKRGKDLPGPFPEPCCNLDRRVKRKFTSRKRTK